MARVTRPHKLKEIEKKMGEPLETLIPRIVEEEGAVYRAAIRLGVAPNTVRRWLLNHGYKPETRREVTWVQDEQPELEMVK